MPESAPDSVRFVLELVGGPWDALPGLSWVTRPGCERKPPRLIFVGECRSRDLCGTTACTGRVHPAFWTPGEPSVPPLAIPYRLEKSRVVEMPDGSEHGQAVYTLGGMGPTGRRDAAVELPRELAGALG